MRRACARALRSMMTSARSSSDEEFLRRALAAQPRDRAEGRTELVRHDREKLVFHPTGLFGPRLRLFKGAPGADRFRHVDGKGDDRVHLALVVAKGLERHVEYAIDRPDRQDMLHEREGLARRRYAIEQGHHFGRRSELLGARPDDLARTQQPTSRDVGKLARVVGDAKDAHERGGEVQRGLEPSTPLAFALPEQLDERLHTGSYDGHVEGLRDVVGCSHAIAAVGVGLVAMDRREEEDGNLAAPLGGADASCGLEAIHRGHLHVNQDGRKPVLRDEIQGLLTGAGFHELGADRLQHRDECHQVRWGVVDQEDARRLGLESVHGSKERVSSGERAQPRDRGATPTCRAARVHDSPLQRHGITSTPVSSA